MTERRTTAALMRRFDSDRSEGKRAGWRRLTLAILDLIESNPNLTPDETDLITAARKVWDVYEPNSLDLERVRVEVWQYMRAKNGDSTTIADNDLTLRALVGSLFPPGGRREAQRRADQTVTIVVDGEYPW